MLGLCVFCGAKVDDAHNDFENKKQTNILGLSEEIHGALDDLQNRLDSRFCRADQVKCSGEKPQAINVLDEIIDNLQEDLDWLRRLTAFISSDVLPKIN